ncbi:MAG: molybdopterin-binding protein, partial [Planctomycetota bacterium]
MNAARIGILTISDRASRGEYSDESGPAIEEFLRENLLPPFETFCRVIPDEQGEIEGALRKMADEEGCCLVVTTGGTGPAVRDVTPEATKAVCDKILDG